MGELWVERLTWRYGCSAAGLSRSTFRAVLIGPGAIVSEIFEVS